MRLLAKGSKHMWTRHSEEITPQSLYSCWQNSVEMTVSTTIQVSNCGFSKSGALFAVNCKYSAVTWHSEWTATHCTPLAFRQHFFPPISLDFPHLSTAALPFSPLQHCIIGWNKKSSSDVWKSIICHGCCSWFPNVVLQKIIRAMS